MKGNFHVQFLGGGAAVTPPCYPARGAAMRPSYPAGGSGEMIKVFWVLGLGHKSRAKNGLPFHWVRNLSGRKITGKIGTSSISLILALPICRGQNSGFRLVVSLTKSNGHRQNQHISNCSGFSQASNVPVVFRRGLKISRKNAHRVCSAAQHALALCPLRDSKTQISNGALSFPVQAPIAKRSVAEQSWKSPIFLSENESAGDFGGAWLAVLEFTEWFFRANGWSKVVPKRAEFQWTIRNKYATIVLSGKAKVCRKLVRSLKNQCPPNPACRLLGFASGYAARKIKIGH
jgi:hypothetical protein